MNIRIKWTKKQDQNLTELVQGEEEEVHWDNIALLMSEAGFDKNAKQCRERLINKMDSSDQPGIKQRKVGFIKLSLSL